MIVAIPTGGLAFVVYLIAWMIIPRPDQLDEALEVVLLAVKSQHTEEAVRQMAPMLDEHSIVISLQNGLNEDIIASLIGAERTIGVDRRGYRG